MTIRKGEAWGEAAIVPDSVRVVPGDLDAHRWVVYHRERGQPIGDVAIAGGDLARTAGGAVEGRFPGQAVRAPLDVLHVVVDGQRETWAIAHVLARRSWWRGPLLWAMNAQYYAGYDIAPRAHPNDGLADVFEVDSAMAMRERLAARQRARHGGHLPHPRLRLTRQAHVERSFDRPHVVWVDGERFGTATTLEITVEPDALTAYL